MFHWLIITPFTLSQFSLVCPSSPRVVSQFSSKCPSSPWNFSKFQKALDGNHGRLEWILIVHMKGLLVVFLHETEAFGYCWHCRNHKQTCYAFNLVSQFSQGSPVHLLITEGCWDFMQRREKSLRPPSPREHMEYFAPLTEGAENFSPPPLFELNAQAFLQTKEAF